jgi:hypothetical protein
MAVTTQKHNPLEPEFRVEETDRRTKIGRVLMIAAVAVAAVLAWMSSS